MQKSKPLQHYVNMSWLLSGAVALIASLFLFLIFGYYNYHRDLEYAQIDLDSKVLTIGRRLSGELLIAPRGSPDAVISQVAQELQLKDVIYGTEEFINKSIQSQTKIYSQIPVPFLEDSYYIRAAIDRPGAFEYFNFPVLLSCFLLTGFIVGLGIFLQTRYLRRHLIRPIEFLVETSTGERNVSDDWPTELQDISRRLNDSFRDRERVVFSQIARGVVHDIKTILQSFKTASDLAKESPTEHRIKNFLNVSQNKLPALLELIDTTLDGSREILVFPRPGSINQTLNRAVENIRSLTTSSKAEINLQLPSHELVINHDPMQLERVFTNLLKNGLESIEECNDKLGKLKISFNLEEHDFVSVVIEDSGTGLPKQADSIFRLLKSTKPHGSGLGLIISKKIIEAHRGRIFASHSPELNGARFEVFLPKGDSK